MENLVKSTFSGRTINLSGAFCQAIDELSRHSARYMVIGGAAMQIRDIERTPRDFDIWIDSHSDNVPRIEKAFVELGASFLGFEIGDIIRQNSISNIVESVYTFSPYDVDFRTRAHGPTFDQCYPNSSQTEWDCRVISLSDLLKMKEEKARNIDLVDAELIRNSLTHKEV